MNHLGLIELLPQLLTHERILANSSNQAFAKGQCVFSQGNICRDIFILKSGLVKLFYLTHDGKEWIKSFIADSGFFGSRLSQIAGSAAPFTAQCLEDTHIIRIPYAIFESVCFEQPEYTVAVFRFSQWLGLRKEQREHELLCLTAEQRYQGFIHDKSELAERITQIDLARYLGITPIALSRIKKRLTHRSSVII